MASDALRHQVTAKWQDAFTRLNRNKQGISGLLSFSRAWNIALDVMHPRSLDEPPSSVDVNQLRTAFAVINNARRLPFLIETFLERLNQQYYLVQRDIDAFMTRFQSKSDPAIVHELVLRLLAWLKHWATPPDLGTTVYATYTLSFQTHLFSIVPPIFATAFKSLIGSTLAELPSTSDQEIWHALEVLGLIDRYEAIIATVGYEFIEQHVWNTCKGEWSRPLITDLRDWMSNNVVPWMLLVYARGAKTTDDARAMLSGVGSRFDFHLNKTLCDLRTREIWDIIIDYPESEGALQDLKECLQRVDQRSALVQALRQANHKRLLHPGADTKLIITQYVATIKCLRIIDPPGVLLFKVADPIRRYLRERPDTIRCIVANLVGDDSDSPDSLLDDMVPKQLLVSPNTLVDDYSDSTWEPEPIDAGPEFRANKPGDVLSTLVSIYDTRDLFVKELQVLLAQRLLSIPISSSSSDGEGPNVDRIEKERRNIEILKLRFGEASLSVCEVMLRDMTDSRRIDTHIQAANKEADMIVHPTIISSHFWPSLPSTAPSSSSTSQLKMSGQFEALQKNYTSHFNKFKPDKTLKFVPTLGSVTVSLEFEDERVIEATVPPLEAAVIELFGSKEEWSLDDLKEGLGGVDVGSVLRALVTWIDMGVVEEYEDREGVFRVIEVQSDRKAERKTHVVAAPELAPATITVDQEKTDKMRVYWKYIEGMLTNLGGLPIDRIQSMLRFVPGYDQSLEQLEAFLDVARREGMLISRDGIWKLNK